MLRTIVIGAVGAAVVSGTGAGALALSSSPSPATPSSSSTSAATHSGKAQRRAVLKAIARRAVHGSVVVRGRDGAFVTVDFGRGTVQALSPTSLTVSTADGQSLTFTLNSSTKYHERTNGKGEKTTYSAVHNGDTVLVVGRAASATATPAAAQVLDLGKK